MIKKILVPLDGSTTAEAVVPLVIHMAQAEKAEIELITVLTPVAIWDAAASMIKWDAEEAGARAYIEGKARELEEMGVKAHSSVAYGQAAYAVFDAVKNKKADFIAMTTHGRTGITRFFLGSVADKLLHSAAPLLVVRPGDDESQRLSPADIRKILVPLDGSDLSLAAIPVAEEMARIFGASLALCSVVSTDWIAYSGMETPIIYQDVLDDMKVRSQEHIEEIAGESRSRGFHVECFVGIGGPADEIQRIAGLQGAGLIVMSTHGRSGPGRWVMGSTADSVVRKTHLPCLLVRPHEVKQPTEHPLEQRAERRPAAGRT